MVKEITTTEEFKEAINNENLVIVDFWAPWCMPCKMFSKVLETTSENEDYKEVTFLKVNVDDAEELAQQEGIRSLPTIRAFKNGEKIDEKIGGLSKDQFHEFLNKNK